MFTGIIEDIGRVDIIRESVKESTYTISVNKLDANEVNIGDSIAVNGVCLTVVSLNGSRFKVDASHETLSRTNLSSLKIGSKVNLERSLKVAGRFGGHIVTGHIDGMAEVVKVRPVGKSVEFWFELPDKLNRYIVEKGSITVDGISLTVNEMINGKFSVNIIPYTKVETTISSLTVGNKVNIECDILAKYVEKLLKANLG